MKSETELDTIQRLSNRRAEMVEYLQERVKRLINERDALQEEVRRLDPTGDIWQRKESDRVQWRQAYERTKAQRDKLAAAAQSALSILDQHVIFRTGGPCYADNAEVMNKLKRALAELEGQQ